MSAVQASAQHNTTDQQSGCQLQHDSLARTKGPAMTYLANKEQQQLRNIVAPVTSAHLLGGPYHGTTKDRFHNKTRLYLH